MEISDRGGRRSPGNANRQHQAAHPRAKQFTPTAVGQGRSGELGMIAWEIFLLSVACMSAGIFTSLPHVPCIWLALGRARFEQRAVALFVLLSLLTLITALDGVLFAVHLIAVTVVLMCWRCAFYERPRYSLSFMFSATFILALFLGLAVPLMESWQPPGNLRWTKVLVSLAVIVPAPALLAWASVALQRRIWAVLAYALALNAFLQWWLLADIHTGWTWEGIWFTLLFQTGYALTIVVVVRTLLRHELVLWPKPKNPRDPLPDRLPWSDPFPGPSAGEV